MLTPVTSGVQSASEEEPFADSKGVPVFRSRRVHIRPFRRSDINATYIGWLNDPEVNRYLEVRLNAQNHETVMAYLEAVSRNQETLFAICLNGDHRHIGNIKVGPVHPYHRHGEIGFFIGDRLLWGKGLATEAISLATGWAFDISGIGRLSASIYRPNRGSFVALQRAGYRFEGRRIGHLLLEGRPCDVLMMGMTAAQYHRIKQR